MTKDVKRVAILSVPYVLIAWIANKTCYTYRMAEGAIGEKLIQLLTHIKGILEGPFISFHLEDLAVGFGAIVVIRAVLYYRKLNSKHYRKGVEYGSARWGTRKDIQPYMDKDPEQNVILTQTEGLTMNSRPKDPKYARNKNVIVIGGSGSGKTRFFVKPNLMQMHSSYCVTDPKGQNLLSCSCAGYFQKAGT